MMSENTTKVKKRATRAEVQAQRILCALEADLDESDSFGVVWRDLSDGRRLMVGLSFRYSIERFLYWTRCTEHAQPCHKCTRDWSRDEALWLIEALP